MASRQPATAHVYPGFPPVMWFGPNFPFHHHIALVPGSRSRGPPLRRQTHQPAPVSEFRHADREERVLANSSSDIAPLETGIWVSRKRMRGVAVVKAFEV